MSDSRREMILTKPLFPLLMRMSIPTIIGMLVSTIYNLTDTFWIGRLENKSMTAAIGIVFAFITFVQALGFWFGYGSGNTMSRMLGAKEEKEASVMAANGMLLALVAGVLIAIPALTFRKSLAEFLGGGVSEELLFFSTNYLSILLWGIPFMLLSTTMYNQLRLCGNTKDAMLGLLIGMLTNIVLDPIFILGCKLGILGAGYATVIGYALSTGCVWYLSFRHGNVGVRFRNVKWSKARCYHILIGGAPNFARQGITSIAAVLVNLVAAGFGETMLAALTVATRIATLGYMAMIGFGQGFQPICAMNYGAQRYDRVKMALRMTTLIATGILVVTTGLLAVFAYPFCGLLSQNSEVVVLAVRLVRYQCISLPFVGMYAIAGMFLQNVGKYFSALLVTIARQGIFFLPLLFFLPRLLGERGLMLLYPAADLLATLFAAGIVEIQWKRIFAEKEQTAPS